MRCMKCKKWGHANTDKSCPMYGKSKLDVDFVVDTTEASEEVLHEEKEEEKPKSSTTEDSVITLEMLNALPKEEKKVLLKRLRKLLKKSKWRKKANIA